MNKEKAKAIAVTVGGDYNKIHISGGVNEEMNDHWNQIPLCKQRRAFLFRIALDHEIKGRDVNYDYCRKCIKKWVKLNPNKLISVQARITKEKDK